MAVSPNVFVDMVVNEILNHQEIVQYHQSAFSGTLLSDSLGAGNGVTTNAKSIHLSKSSRDKRWNESSAINYSLDGIKVGVEYLVDDRKKSFDVHDVLRIDSPRGVIVYGDSCSGSRYVTVVFDLVKEKIIEVEFGVTSENTYRMLKSLKRLPLQKGVSKFFKDIYSVRGLPVEEVVEEK